MRALIALDRFLGAALLWGGVLVLPVSLLLFLQWLFLQWPLRDLVHSYSREANDFAQLLFALYVSLAVTCATRHHAHFAADAFARRYPLRVRSWLNRVAAAITSIPWSSFIIYAALPGVLQSVIQIEAFPETFNPGYFVVRACVALLALLVLVQALLDLILARAPETH